MTNADLEQPDRTDGPSGLSDDLRAHLLEVLRLELARACVAAMARGVPAVALERSLDVRAARLDSADVEDGQDDPDDALHLRRVVE